MEHDLKERYNNVHLLDRLERMGLARDLLKHRPEFLRPITEKWWWYKPCPVNVLIVTDGTLNYSITDGFGLSEFVTTFQRLETGSFLRRKYNVTLAHRGNPTDDQMMISNAFVHHRITGFSFETSVNLDDFDQVWLFGILPGAGLESKEVSAVEAYMNGGGGLFATGDHGTLGSALCSQIPRVKDMRLWANTHPDPNVNEVSMDERRRNDTNRPGLGQVNSSRFNNQSDNIPQIISVRTFSGLPHPLLSVSTSIRASGMLDVMPDHPHEGQCATEKVFRVKNPVTGGFHFIRSQNIATSFVLANSITENDGKDPTDAHSFPSIGVWDGRVANVGRIVVDSTWHHFVNINLNGVGSGPLTGLTDADFDLVQRYYMNVSNWITRKKSFFCWYRWIWPHLLYKSQLVEASLNNPKMPLKEIPLADLYSIGALAKEVLSEHFSPAMAHELLVMMIEPTMPELADQLNVWKPETTEKPGKKEGYHKEWINLENILGTAIGAGFIALRDDFGSDAKDLNEKSFEKMGEVFNKGLQFGIDASIKHLSESFQLMSQSVLAKRAK